MDINSAIRIELNRQGIDPKTLRYATKETYGYSMKPISTKKKQVLEKICTTVYHKNSQYSISAIAEELFYMIHTTY